jgi:hypothetical protein
LIFGVVGAGLKPAPTLACAYRRAPFCLISVRTAF